MSERRHCHPGRAALAGALACALVVTPCALAGAAGSDTAGLQSQMDALNTQFQALQQQMSTRRQQLDAARRAAATAQHRLGVARGSLNAEAAYIDGLNAEIATGQQHLTEATARLAAADVQLQAAQVRADDGLRMLDEGGTVRFVSVLFGSASFGQFLTRFHFLQDIFAANVAALRQVRTARDAQSAQRAQLQRQEDALGALQTEATYALQRLSAQAAEAKTAANAAQALAWSQDQEIRADTAASAQVAAQLANLHIQYDRAQGKLVFLWPMPAPHVITDPYGPRINPFTHQHEIHTGVDIAEPSGTPIHAAAAGVVAFVGWQNGYGNCTILYHGKVDGQDYYTLYAHQSKLGVTAHETVDQGQVIGYVGMTGWATGPHLHFEIRIGGNPVDPMPYLPQTGIQIDY